MNTEAFHQEIADLEAKLAAKKQELMQSGAETPEKQVFKEVIREHAFTSEIPAVGTSTASQQAVAPRVATHDEEQKIATLIAQAFTKGIAIAVAAARKFGDPFLIDMLHDRLADEYYQKLLTARKINQ